MNAVLRPLHSDEATDPPYRPVASPVLPLSAMREIEKLEGTARFTAGVDVLMAAGVCVLPSLILDGGASKPIHNDAGREFHRRESTEGLTGAERAEAVMGLFPPENKLNLSKHCVSWQGLSAIDVDIKKMLSENPGMSVKEATLRVFAQTGLLNKSVPPFWMSVSRSGGYHFVFLSVPPESGWDNPSKHAVNGTTIDIFSGQRPSASHLVEWPTPGYIGVPLLDDPAAFIEERFGLAPDGQPWPFFQASLLAWSRPHLTMGRPSGPLLQWFIDKAGKAPRSAPKPGGPIKKAKAKGGGTKDSEEPEPTKEDVFWCLDDLIAIYRIRPDASRNYITDEEQWSGLMANVKYCGEEVGAEEEVKDYWLDKFCPAAGDLFGLDFDRDENEKRYDAKKAVEDDGKHINGVASLRNVVAALRKEIQHADIAKTSAEVRSKGEVFLVVNKSGRQSGFCVPFGLALPLEISSSVLVGASGIAYSPHLNRPDFNPFRKLRNQFIRLLRDKIGVPEMDDDDYEDGGDAKFDNLVSGMMLKHIRETMPARMGIDIAITGVLGDRYEGEQSLRPIGKLISVHNAVADIREFMTDRPVPYRDDEKALEFCRSLILAFGNDIPAVAFFFRVMAHKVRWPSTHISLLISAMSMATSGADGKESLKGGTGKGFSVRYFSENFLCGRHSFQYDPNARFNGHDAQTLIKVWDEHPDPYDKSAAVRASFRSGMDEMKRVSADVTCEIEYKNENITLTRNDVLYMMFTNAATGAGNQESERRVLSLCSVSAASMPPHERTELGKRLMKPAYRNAVLELISVAAPLSEDECHFAPRTERGKEIALEAELKSSPRLDALLKVAKERAEDERAEHGPRLAVTEGDMTLETLADEVNEKLAENSATRGYMMLSANSGLSSLMPKLATESGKPIFIKGRGPVKADRQKGRIYQPGTWKIDLFAYDELKQELDGLGDKQKGPPTLSPEELTAAASALLAAIRGQQ